MRQVIFSVLILALGWGFKARAQTIDPLPTVVISDYKFIDLGHSGNILRIDGIYYDGNELIIANGPVGIQVLEPETGKILRRLDNSSLEVRGLTADQDNLYVVGEPKFDGQLMILDRKTFAIKKTISLGVVGNQYMFPTGVTIHEGKAYITGNPEAVQVVDLQSGKQVEVISGFDKGSWHTALGPVNFDGNSFYFTHWGVGRVDLASKSVTEFPQVVASTIQGIQVGLPEFPGQAIVLGNRVFVTDDYHGVGEVDKASGKLLRYITANYFGDYQQFQPMRGDRLQFANGKFLVAGSVAYTIFTVPK